MKYLKNLIILPSVGVGFCYVDIQSNKWENDTDGFLHNFF